MDCDALRDDQWERLKGFVPGGTKGKRGPRTNNRLFLDALLWTARSGGRWRDLPERLGDYRSVKRRYYRWIEMGVLAREADLEWLMIDKHHRAGASPCCWCTTVKKGRMPRVWVGLGVDWRRKSMLQRKRLASRSA